MNRIAVGIIARAIGCAVVLHAPMAGATTETVLHSFSGLDGAYPVAGLLYVNGTLYGTTQQGGSSPCGGLGCGTAFSIDLITGKETVVHSFHPGDGIYPDDGLIIAKGKLYGTTEYGGVSARNSQYIANWAQACGTVFSLDPKTGAERLLHLFTGTDGCRPVAGLLNVSGTLYGTTQQGGSSPCGGLGCGTVFSINMETGVETVLHVFSEGSDGFAPTAGLINVRGTLFGTTERGGANGGGTVFSIDPKTGTHTVLYSFRSNPDGDSPFAGLLEAKGILYGTTWEGGEYSAGTVFSFDLISGVETLLYTFGPDGWHPLAGLIKVGNALYGTTSEGDQFGTVFYLDRETGAETVIYSFSRGADGYEPQGSLINVNGTLYGTTRLGGADGRGTVFSIKP